MCASSLKALILASQAIKTGYRNVLLVVGTESMTNAPFYLPRGDHGYGEIKLIVRFILLHLIILVRCVQDGIQRDGITDATLNDAMGLCAEKSAKDYECTRADQDAFAIESYARAAESWKVSGRTDFS